MDAPASRAMKLFYVGLVMYGISFLLPALSMGGAGIPGWTCAWTSLWVWGNAAGLVEPARTGLRLTAFGGLINLATIAHGFLSIRNRAPGIRLALALTILLSVPPMWLSLLLCDLSPYIGHALWITGCILMISRDLTEGWQRFWRDRNLEHFTSLWLEKPPTKE